LKCFDDELRDCQRAITLTSGELQERLKKRLAELEVLQGKNADNVRSSE
jgi:hypothetical protein